MPYNCDAVGQVSADVLIMIQVIDTKKMSHSNINNVNVLW